MWKSSSELASELNVNPRTIRKWAAGGKVLRKRSPEGIYLYRFQHTQKKTNRIEIHPKVPRQVSTHPQTVDPVVGTKQLLNSRQRLVSYEFGNHYIIVVPLADQHIGSDGVLYDRMYSDAKLITQSAHTYVLNLGDTIDNFLIGQLQRVGALDCFGIGTQRRLLAEYLKQLASCSLGFISGNHELFTYLLTRLDPLQDIAENLDVPYDKYEMYLELKVGDQTYRIHARHQFKGSSTYHDLQAAFMLYHKGDHEVFGDRHPDVVLLGHTHSYSYAKLQKNGKLRVFAVTGSYKVDDEYAKRKCFPSALPLFPVLVFHPDKYQVDILDDLEFAVTKYLPYLNKKGR